jgi:hypothetical protein
MKVKTYSIRFTDNVHEVDCQIIGRLMASVSVMGILLTSVGTYILYSKLF